MDYKSRTIRVIWVVCLLLAALNHAYVVIQHGLAWDYGGVSSASAVYWTSLTIIDPLVAAMLVVRPKTGILLTVVLITTNVAHNLAVMAAFAPDGEFLARAMSSPLIISQVAFMAFVAATAHIAWPHKNKTSKPRRT